ncbi:cytochrome c oxidase subunit II [Halomonas sp. PAMB 3264]|uniref:cytochrome c oxidase subunit II n=1 Tax=Halomonas sp. PAMB 3264 TaxID=3075222 RepID=UPI0028A1AF7B|nr:cytochrome c oxidase subunit II [Halomonas sp. PAMB 3264]WNL41077.1 cytochrome c oxidase subunit II [Halomonas sp. PAMB 3264]
MRERNHSAPPPRRIQRASRRRVNLAALTLLLAAPILLAGCGGDHSILNPAGPAARDIRLIWFVMLGFGTVVFVVVIALWLYTFKKRYVTRTPAQERRIGRRWIIGGGIILPTLTVIALLMFGVPTGKRMLTLPLDEPPEVIEVIGHQWWWEVRYPGAEGGEVVTANQLMMPAGEPVDFHVTAADVIHGFWIPRLGGKIDMLPGRINRIRLEADEPGVFGAQCAELCGVGHAHMKLHVEALPRAEFDAWLAARSDEALAELAAQNAAFDTARDNFTRFCSGCHQVAGISASNIGPNLSDVGGREALGAGVMAMEEGAVYQWLRNHQTLKPSNLMPRHDDLDNETLRDLGAWLETLTP